MNNSKRLTFDSIKTNKVDHLFGDSSKPYCNLILNIAYPSVSANAKLKDSLTRSIIALCLGNEYANFTPQQAVQKYTTNYLSLYRKQLEPTFSQESDSSIYQWFNYYRSVIGRVKYQTDKILTYQMDFNEYTGGAHNLYSTSFQTYDLQRMTVIKLDDLFKLNYQNELTSIIVAQLMKDKDIKSAAELAEKGYGTVSAITPTENFYFNDDDEMVFFYNVYEIAPYSMGTIQVKIPIEALKNIMTTTKFQSLGLI